MMDMNCIMYVPTMFPFYIYGPMNSYGEGGEE